jgi:E3 ubiquitin-protein ligase UBR1
MHQSEEEQQLCLLLRDLPKEYGNRYTEAASNKLVEALFLSLIGHREEYLKDLFPQGCPARGTRWSLKTAQGAVEGAEYTEAARGHPCGHIFKSGEATYRCRTCSEDDTCVLCSKCFEASDHDGHMVYVSVSPGNSGCCDCGDPEAWLRSVNCTIHSELEGAETQSTAKGKSVSLLPMDLRGSIRMTIARALDYFCDVWSCSPEQLRLPKTEKSVKEDEQCSRLSSEWYGTEDTEQDSEYALVLWNDEKHTVHDVRDIVARACRKSLPDGLRKAHQVDNVGRSILLYSTDLPNLLHMAKIIEQPKLTVTVRSSRDTFREAMCETIIEWILDIAGCSVGPDKDILRSTICEEFLSAWRVGSAAHHKVIGKDGIDDHEIEEPSDDYLTWFIRPRQRRGNRRTQQQSQDTTHANVDQSDETDENVDEDTDMMDVDEESGSGDRDEMEVTDEMDDALEASEATLAGYPPPPPPPPGPFLRHRIPGVNSGDSDDGETAGPQMLVPKTPMVNPRILRHPVPPKYWQDRPVGYGRRHGIPLYEDLWQRVRLDFFILYDLRMWKKLRTDIRDVLISTVVNNPFFKRMLGLRFAGVYTVLAELYLIADREPDHSIINLSLQMLTTPSITAEVIERGNFLTNLMAILYTFLTTRQVGYPSDVNLSATLAFDQGAVSNRRIYQFYHDMQHLLSSELVQERIRTEEKYLLQFLDLVKLHQGICPNMRAVGEHLEYEADAWIQAQVVTTEIMKLCRKIADSFYIQNEQDASDLSRAIRHTAKFTIINSLGAERRRFDQSEIKSEVRFKQLGSFEFDREPGSRGTPYSVVNFSVKSEHLSFHHALHYALSWLLDRAKGFSADQVRRLLLFSSQELKQPPVPQKSHIPEHEPEDNLLALFDYPLRLCAWLAQMRAGMWVRNGITLRHQMQTYRGSSRNNLAFQRDIFLLQTAMVVCSPATMLASIVDRFDVLEWVKGDFQLKPGDDEQQKLDIAEDFIHLLIVLLSDRIYLHSPEEDKTPQLSITRRDIVHALCFKPLTHSELIGKISEKISDTAEFHDLLREMTNYKPPEGLTDSGTFVLKDEYFEEVDPYLAYFTRNQRDEAESVYRKHAAKKTGKDPSEVYFMPKLALIKSGLFKDLSGFTKTPIFAQIIFYFLRFAISYEKFLPNLPATKVEQFLSFVVHLALVAVLEDCSDQNDGLDVAQVSFCRLALTKHSQLAASGPTTIAGLLREIAEREAFKVSQPKVLGILRHIRHKRPMEYTAWMTSMNLPVDRSNTGSPAPLAAQEKELKKKQALERQARVMAQMKQQQASFIQNQIDWGEDDFSDDDEALAALPEEQETTWKFPAGTCILCQEEVNSEKLYGTFAMINESRILRQTDVTDPDWVGEALDTPDSLDRSAEAIRPYGVASQNKRMIRKVTADGSVIEMERQELGKGWPSSQTKSGPVSTGCGHIMHFSCFEIFLGATSRRHNTQISRNHPERTELKEFLCPLCKALGNTFLPVVWKGKQLAYPGALENTEDFDSYLKMVIPQLHNDLNKLDGLVKPERLGDFVNSANAEAMSKIQDEVLQRSQSRFLDYGTNEMVAPLASHLPQLTHPDTDYRSNPGSLRAQRDALLNALPNFLQFGPEESYNLTNLSHLIPGLNEQSGQTIPAQLLELIKVYQRLRDTMKANHLESMYPYLPNTLNDDLTYTDTLIRTLGFSISAFEIAQRGVEAAPGYTLLEKLSSQQVTHLRVLSETISAYIAVGGLRRGGLNNTNDEFMAAQFRQLQQLFGCVNSSTREYSYEDLPLLLEDGFILLTELSAVAVPAFNLQIHHVMRLCYTAELVRVIIAFLDGGINLPDDWEQSPEPGDAFRNFAISVMFHLGSFSKHQVAKPQTHYRALLRVVESYALAFLRKCTIFMSTRYGVEFPPDFSGAHDSELRRLSRALRLPMPEEVISELHSENSFSATVVQGWFSHWLYHRNAHRDIKHAAMRDVGISLSHPAIFELVGLPKMFSTLQDEVMKRRCPTTGKDLSDAFLCLFCGELNCGQAICCSNADSKGGCYQHRLK